MSRALRVTACLLLLTSPVWADEPADEPLPRGAVCRIGSTRFRQPAPWCLAWSPDGKVLASGGHDNAVRLWGATGKEVVRLEGHAAAVYCVAFSRDGKRIATGSYDQTVRLWDAATGKEVRRFDGHRAAVESVAFSPDGSLLASGGSDDAARAWEVATGKEVWRWDGGRQSMYVHAVVFSPDGKRLAVGGTGKEIALWDVGGWKRGRTLLGHTDRVIGLAFTPDGKELLSAGFDRTVRLWDAATGEERRRYGPETSLVRCLGLSADGRSAAAGYVDGTVRVFDVASGRALASWRGDRDCIVAVAWSPDGRVLATTSWGMVRLWDAAGKRLNADGGREEGVCRLAFAPDGTRLAVGRAGRLPEAPPEDGRVALHDPRTGRELAALKGQEGHLSGLAFSPDGKVLATAAASGRVRLWDGATGEARPALPKQPHPRLDALGFGPGGLCFVSGLDLVCWDVTASKERARVRLSDVSLSWPALSPDGRWLAVTTGDEAFVLWRLPEGQKVRGVGQERSGGALAFSPGGGTVVSAQPQWDERDAARPAFLWETATGGERLRLPAGGPTAAAFAPDGRLLVTASRAAGVRLWDALTGRELARLSGHRGYADAVAFSPDGSLLATGGADTTVLVWDVSALLPARARAAPLRGAEVQALWDDLAADDPARAWRAAARLADDERSLPPLRERLRAGAGPDAARLAKLVAALDDEDFAAREKAHAELAELGRLAAPALRRALEGRPPPELARRAKELLDRLPQGPSPAEIRLGRAVELLEMVGTAEARAALRDLGGDSEAAAAARSALERLARRQKEGAHR
jgi:WD40 repeat protein